MKLAVLSVQEGYEQEGFRINMSGVEKYQKWVLEIVAKYLVLYGVM